MTMPSHTQTLPIAGIGHDRRSALRLALQTMAGAALAAPALSLSACAPDPGVLAADRRALLRALYRLTIPAVPNSAASADVAFVYRAMEKGFRGLSLGFADAVGKDLDKNAGGDFIDAPAGRQLAALEKLDETTFASAEPISHAWYGVKAMLLVAYFNSQQGMEETLRYELVPGRYEPDVVVDDDFVALSNDWSAVSLRKPLVQS